MVREYKLGMTSTGHGWGLMRGVQTVPSLAEHYLVNPVVRDWLGPKPYYILMYLTYGE